MRRPVIPKRPRKPQFCKLLRRDAGRPGLHAIGAQQCQRYSPPSDCHDVDGFDRIKSCPDPKPFADGNYNNIVQIPLRSLPIASSLSPDISVIKVPLLIVLSGNPDVGPRPRSVQAKEIATQALPFRDPGTPTLECALDQIEGDGTQVHPMQ